MPIPRPVRRRLAATALGAATGLAAIGAGPAAEAAPARPAAPSGATATCPAEAGTPRFVRFIYLEILNRCPDPSGMAYWTSKLDGGTSRWSFAEAVDMSNENLVKNNARPLYEEFLGREPTADEINDVVVYLRARHQDGPIVAGLVASDEFYDAMEPPTPVAPSSGGASAPVGVWTSTAQHDRAWLDTAYQIIVERSADPAGAAYWMGTFGEDGSSAAERYRVAYALEHTRSNALGWVQGVYFAGLNRPPDPSGQEYWVNWLQGAGKWQTFRLWTRTLASDEAYRRSQTEPSPEHQTEARLANRTAYQGGR